MSSLLLMGLLGMPTGCSIGPHRGVRSERSPELDLTQVLLLDLELRGVDREDRDDAVRVIEGVLSREGVRTLRESELEVLRDADTRAELRGDGSPARLGAMATKLGVGRIIDGWLGVHEGVFVWVLSVVEHDGRRQGTIAGSAPADSGERWAQLALTARGVLFPVAPVAEVSVGALTRRLEERNDAWLCLGEALLGGESQAAPGGRAMLEIRIETDGKASEVSVEDSSLGDRSLEFCLEEVGRSIDLGRLRPESPARLRIPVLVPESASP